MAVRVSACHKLEQFFSYAADPIFGQLFKFNRHKAYNKCMHIKVA